MKRLGQLIAGGVRHPRSAELFGIDVRGLAAFRIGIAVLLLIDLANRARFLTAHYTDSGLVSRSLMIPNMKSWSVSLYWLNGSMPFVAIMFLIAAVFALMLLVGYRTRLATIVSWMLLVSLHYRNPLVCHAGDHVLRLLLFWGMFLPLGIAASVDSRLSRDGEGNNPRQVVLSLGTLGLLLQVVFIYVFSALLKTSSVWYPDGTALYYALNLDRLTMPLGRWLLNFPELCRLLSLGTIGLEMFGPAIAFIPFGTKYFRTLAVLLFAGFHLGMAMMMCLILFPYVCIAAWIVFLPPWFWDKMSATRFGELLVRIQETVVDRCAGWIDSRAQRDSLLAWKPAPYRQRISTNVLAGLCLLYVFGWNIHSVTKKNPTFSFSRAAEKLRLSETVKDGVAGIGSLLGVSQGWIMFSPYPPREDGWWIVAATSTDGSQVDLYRGGREISWDKPASVSAEFTSHRWRRYVMSLWSGRQRYHTPHYARWLRNEWDAAHDEGQHIASMEIYFMMEYTRPPGEPPLNAKLLVYRWNKTGKSRLVSYADNKREYRRLLKQAER